MGFGITVIGAPYRIPTHGYEPTREAAMAAFQELAAGIGRVLINAQIAVPLSGSCSQIKQGCAGCYPDCKHSCPCRRTSNSRQPRREFAFGLSFARFARFEIRLDPTQARIECDLVRS